MSACNISDQMLFHCEKKIFFFSEQSYHRDQIKNQESFEFLHNHSPECGRAASEAKHNMKKTHIYLTWHVSKVYCLYWNGFIVKYLTNRFHFPVRLYSYRCTQDVKMW